MNNRKKQDNDTQTLADVRLPEDWVKEAEEKAKREAKDHEDPEDQP